MFERCSLHISLHNKKEASSPFNFSVCLSPAASPQHVARWHLRSAFTSSISECSKLRLKEGLWGITRLPCMLLDSLQ